MGVEMHQCINQWQQIVSKLQSMALALLGSGGLFSMLQLGLKHADKN
jgi:hypothetical protein